MGFKKASRQSVGRRTPCEDSSSKSVSVEKLSGLKGMNHPWHITFCQIHILICHSQQSWEESLFWTPLKRCRNQDSSEGVAESCQAAGPDFFFILSKYMNRVLVPSQRQQGKTPICSCYIFCLICEQLFTVICGLVYWGNLGNNMESFWHTRPCRKQSEALSLAEMKNKSVHPQGFVLSCKWLYKFPGCSYKSQVWFPSSFW